MSKKFNITLCRGFSFVELSVVLAAITAIILMVVSGFALIKNQKVNKVISDINNFTEAIEQFEKQYGALPGDISNVSSVLADTSGGNGNGAIDTNEELDVWQQLSAAGLIEGSFDGSSEYTPGVGVPSSDIEGGGYNIKLPSDVTAADLPEQAIVIELAGFNETNNDLPIVTASDARAIDKKADDGNPNTGTILAEGFNNDCVTVGNEYNLSNNVASCRLLFVIRPVQAHKDAPDITGTCTELGQTRRINDSGQTCPEGFAGSIVQTCRVNEDNQGVWEITERNCTEVNCGKKGTYGDIRKLSCINGMVGTEGVVQKCNASGVWEFVRSDCQYNENQPCETDGEFRQSQACGWGQTGFVLQECVDNKWNVPTSPPNLQCSNIQCGTNNIGDTRTTSTCGSNYTGQVVEVCTIGGTWETTSIGSTCSPVYGSCNSGSDNKQDIGCPPGQEGEHILQCIDNNSSDYWTTLKNTCEPIRCSGGESIGSVRIKKGAYCPNNKNGEVMEYCDKDGVWQETYTNCVSGVCESPTDNAGNALWPTATAGTLADYTSCLPGYRESSPNPTRQCNSNGTWGTPNNPCERITCPSVDNNANYPVTYAGESNVAASSCIAGYSQQSPNYPLSDCDIDGNWVNERMPCVSGLSCSDLTNVMGLDVCPTGDLNTPTDSSCIRFTNLLTCDPDNITINDVMVYAGDVPGTSTDFFIRRCDLGQDYDEVDGRCEDSSGTTTSRSKLQWKSTTTNSATSEVFTGTSPTSTSAKDGPGSTQLLVADTSGDHYAAEACDSLPSGDWYLPAIAELDIIYANLVGTDDSPHPLSTIDHPDELLDVGTVGPLRDSFYTTDSFPDDIYWTSSEKNIGGGWRMRFYDGTHSGHNKTNARNVRCARRNFISSTSIMGRTVCPSGDLTSGLEGCGRLFGSDPTNIDDVMFYAGDVPGTTTDFFVRRCDLGQDWDPVDERCEHSDGTTTNRGSYNWKNSNDDSATIGVSAGTVWTDTYAIDGPTNTTTLVGDPSGIHPAAETCAALPGGDWYLPAISELDVIYANLVGSDDPDHPLPTVADPSHNSNSGTTGTMRDSFDLTTYYWSSSELGTGNAWRQRLDSGMQVGMFKALSFYVRCTRR